MITAAELARSRRGRCALHLGCIARRPRTTGFQLAGIWRECGSGLSAAPSTYYPKPPLFPIVIAALAVITWWVLR